MRRFGCTVVVGVVLGMLAAGCGADADVGEPEVGEEPVAEAPEVEDPDAEPSAPDEEPGSEQPPPESETEAPEGLEDEDTSAQEVTVFFVRDAPTDLWVEPETHELDERTEAVARAALEIAFSGEPHDPQLRSAGLDDVRILATNIRDRILIVDVSDDIEGHGTGSAGEMAFALQLANTGAAFPTVDAVQLWVEGEPIDELWGHLDWSEPFEPAPDAISPITILEPAAGPGEVTVQTGTVVVRGEARVFEATFGLRLLGSDGEVIEETFVTASEGAPGRGDFEHTFTIDQPGTYTIEAEEYDPSDGEGRPPFVTTRQVEVR